MTETELAKKTFTDPRAEQEMKSARSAKERKEAYMRSRESHIKSLEEERAKFVSAAARCAIYLKSESAFLHNDYVLDQIKAEIVVARKRGESEKVEKLEEVSNLRNLYDAIAIKRFHFTFRSSESTTSERR